MTGVTTLNAFFVMTAVLLSLAVAAAAGNSLVIVNNEEIRIRKNIPSKTSDTDRVTALTPETSGGTLTSRAFTVAVNRDPYSKMHVSGSSSSGRRPYLVGSKGYTESQDDLHMGESGRGMLLGYDKRPDGGYRLSQVGGFNSKHGMNYGDTYGHGTESLMGLGHVKNGHRRGYMKRFGVNPMMTHGIRHAMGMHGNIDEMEYYHMGYRGMLHSLGGRKYMGANYDFDHSPYMNSGYGFHGSVYNNYPAGHLGGHHSPSPFLSGDRGFHGGFLYR